MKEAICEGNIASEKGEIPVGAVIVRDGIILAKGHNTKEFDNDPTQHAEIIVIKNACKTLGTWRLDNCDLYVTLEPCPMCAGALLQSRIRRLIFGAYDMKAGACGSVINVLDSRKFNHQVDVTGGILEHECMQLLRDFFKKLRG